MPHARFGVSGILFPKLATWMHNQSAPHRIGVDTDWTPEKLVFNRTVTLRDTWAKIEKAMKGKVES